MTHFLVLALLLFAALNGLVGCDNAHQTLSVQQWNAVGISQPPADTLNGELVATVADAGSGPSVEVGDLVKIRLTEIFAKSAADPSPKKAAPRVVWLWTGREPGGRDSASVRSWGDPGSPRLRKLLIGRHVGERFEIKLDPKAEGIVVVPRYGFSLAPETPHTLHGAGVWPSMNLGYRQPKGSPLAEIEILNSCPGRLFRRSATLKQWGFIFNAFEMDYDISRQGTLRWSAIEATCEPPDGKVRFEIGPIYFYAGRHDLSLYNWQMSYRKLRTPKDFPEEYDVLARTMEEKRELLERRRQLFSSGDAGSLVCITTPVMAGVRTLTWLTVRRSCFTQKPVTARRWMPSLSSSSATG